VVEAIGAEARSRFTAHSQVTFRCNESGRRYPLQWWRWRCAARRLGATGRACDPGRGSAAAGQWHPGPDELHRGTRCHDEFAGDRQRGHGNPSLTLTQLGGGFTWSKDLPLYLEAMPLGRATTGVPAAMVPAAPVPVKWNSVSVSGGLGWDFPLAPNWVCGRCSISLWPVDQRPDRRQVVARRQCDQDLAAVDHGKLEARGIGGSLMIDYEKFAPDADVDLELRYTNVKLRNSGALAMTRRRRLGRKCQRLGRRACQPAGWSGTARCAMCSKAYTRFLGQPGRGRR